MCEGIVQEGLDFFKNGQTNIQDEERSVRLSVVTNDIVEKIDGRYCPVDFTHYFQTVYNVKFSVNGGG